MSGKTSGMGDNFYVGGYNLSNDTASIDQITGGPTLMDMTGIDKLGTERIGTLRSGGMSFTTFMNNAALAEHAALSTLPRTDTIATYFRGTTLGNPVACVNAKQINYDETRSDTGELTWKTEVQSNKYGLEWGNMLTAGLRTDTTGTAGSPVDFGAATSFGFQAYLQVIGFTGTSITIKLQDATTSGGTYADITSGAFVAVTSTTPQAQRIAVGGTATVREFVKVTTTGTFTSCTFAVVLVKNTVGVSF